jgi:hypothetical protein
MEWCEVKIKQMPDGRLAVCASTEDGKVFEIKNVSEGNITLTSEQCKVWEISCSFVWTV